MKKLFLSLLLVTTLVLSACSKNEPANTATTQDNEAEKPTIVATFYPVYEFTQKLMGDEANVELLIPAGTEVHGYEPSTSDIAKIQEADVFVYEDPNMETWVPSALESVKKEEAKVIQATEGLLLLPGGEEHDHDHDHDHGEEGHHHEFDPHLWLSPYRSIKLVENLRDGLIENYPDKKDVIEKNAEAYLAELKALDEEYTNSLSQAKQKYFVTQHTAFAYLAMDYGLKQVSITGLSADTDPTIVRLEELSEYINKYQIKYIYFEENAKQSVAESLAKETGAELEVLNPLESLTKEQMDAGENYISVMKANLAALEKTTTQEGPEILPEDGAEDNKTVYNGYFEDSEVKDRELSDYAGEWRSVYPLLLNGTLDEVFDYKAKKSGSMTAEEYKQYYDTGYKTDIEQINITDDTMEFVVNGKAEKYTYKYVGKEILNYAKGNRGVRFLFEATDDNAGEYKYVQFSDHNIAPVKTLHFHIYLGGESQEKLLEELEHWPTYYPLNMTDMEIAQEMLAH